MLNFREGVKLRAQLVKQLMITGGRIQNNLQRYFPEFTNVFRDWKGKAAICQEWSRYQTGNKAGRNSKKSVGIIIGLCFGKQELNNLLVFKVYKGSE